jgi:membrane-bound serine protease (ClpP class)
MRIRLTTAVALALPFALITVTLVSLVVRARRNKVVTGSEGMVGEIATVVVPLTPEGTVLLRGEYWGAVASAPVAADAKVRVTGVANLKLTVEPVEAQQRSGGVHEH